MAEIKHVPSKESSEKPTLSEAFWIWASIGILSFGGPAAQISLMHRVIVEEKKWLSETQYLNALSFCMLLPGPEAMQLATYAGWRLHGIIGGLIAGLLFIIPGAIVVLILSMIYAGFGDIPLIKTVFLGIKAAVLIIVIEALLRVSRKALKTKRHWIVAGCAFVAIFFLGLPYPLIIFLTAIYGFFFMSTTGEENSHSIRPHHLDTVKTVVLWSTIWLLPIAVLYLTLEQGHILSDIGLFFSKLAVVTFGGAYAVLAYMGQDVVVAHGWLDAGQMMDGLGLAETTPGPLILVTQFVGYLAAYQASGTNLWYMGLYGAFISLWATFAPCFMWIFAGAPYIEWINAQPKLKGALSGITAAVVGVILNLSIWFALHVFFIKVDLIHTWGMQFWTPELTTLEWNVVIIAGLNALLLLRWHWKIPHVLAVSAIFALALNFMT